MPSAALSSNLTTGEHAYVDDQLGNGIPGRTVHLLHLPYRMNPAPIEIHRISPFRLADFLAFFDGEAFADNPKWGFCYCQFAYVNHSVVEWKERTVQQNRGAACARIQGNSMYGYLAYRDGKPIGWCNAAPRAALELFADEPDPDSGNVGEITCFIVASTHRGTGAASALLAAACEGFRHQGLTIVEATTNPSASTDAENHHGPLSMFLSAGFRIHRTEEDGYVTVRRELASVPDQGEHDA